MTTVPAAIISRFSELVEEGRVLVGGAPEIEEFGKFLLQARSLVVDPILTIVEHHGRQIRSAAERWFTKHDVLQVARVDWLEDSYTELLAWTLKPHLHQASALDRQQCWLKSLGIEIETRQPAIPQTQVATIDGVPDLVLLYDVATVVVEAKTGTEEHRAPSGEYQTLAYPEAVRARFNLAPDHPIYVVFITLQGRRPANPAAFIATFGGFGLTLATVLDRYDLHGNLRFAFGTVITHFMTCGVAPDMRERFFEHGLSLDDPTDQHEAVMRNLRGYSLFADVFGGDIMADKSSGFSDSCRLYAKNADVVAVLQKRFQEEVDSLLRAIAQSLKQTFGKRFQQTTSVGNQDKWWYCWLGAGSDKWKVPWIMIVATSAAIVEPGVLKTDLRAPDGTSSEEYSALKTLVNNPDLGKYWQPGAPAHFGSLALPCRGVHPTDEILQPLMAVLTAMDEIHRQFAPERGLGQVP